MSENTFLPGIDAGATIGYQVLESIALHNNNPVASWQIAERLNLKDEEKIQYALDSFVSNGIIKKVVSYHLTEEGLNLI